MAVKEAWWPVAGAVATEDAAEAAETALDMRDWASCALCRVLRCVVVVVVVAPPSLLLMMLPKSSSRRLFAPAVAGGGPGPRLGCSLAASGSIVSDSEAEAEAEAMAWSSGATSVSIFAMEEGERADLSSMPTGVL